MAYVIAEPCIGVKDTACVDACPVDCIHPKKNTTYDDGRPGFEEVSVVSLPGKVSQATVSEDIRYLAVAFQNGGVQRILVWDMAANSQRWVFGEYGGNVTYLGFSPDGHLLVVNCDDGEIGLWSITDGKALPSPARRH